MKLIAKECNFCGTEHFIQPSDIRNGKGKFCSKTCRYTANGIGFRTGSETRCSICPKKVYRPKNRLNKKPYCSTTCQHKGMLSGNTRSCGVCRQDFYCIQSTPNRKYCSVQCRNIANTGAASHNATHLMSGSKIYRLWSMMKDRCNNPNNTRYEDWGGRGIRVCERWNDSFEEFYADMGDRPNGKTLDRVDNTKDYSPENCKWSTAVEQRSNTRVSLKTTSINGVTKPVAVWAREYSVSYAVASRRIRSGWTGEKIFLSPIKPGYRPQM